MLKGALALAALGYLVVVIEPAAIWAALTEARWAWIGAALALMPATLVLDGVVWRHLLHPVVPNASARQLAGAVLSGFALGFVTPARAGEFVGRAFYLPDADPWSVSLTIFVQRLVDTVLNVSAGVATLGLVLYIGVLDASPAWTLLLAGGGAFALLLVGFLVAPASATRLVHRLFPDRPALHSRLDVLRAYRPRTMARTVGWAGVRYGLFSTQFILLIYAFAPDLALPHAICAVALTFFVKFIVPSVTLMDLGIQEGAAVFFLSLFGVAQAVAFNAALLLFLINIVVPTLLGVPFVSRLRLDRSESDSRTVSPSPASADLPPA